MNEHELKEIRYQKRWEQSHVRFKRRMKRKFKEKEKEKIQERVVMYAANYKRKEDKKALDEKSHLSFWWETI